MRFNETGPDALVTRKAPGQPSRLTPVQQNALSQAVEDGPRLPSTAWCAGS